LEQGSLEQELGAGERLESERDPRKTQVSILLFFLLFIFFVCLWSSAAQDTQRSNAAPQAEFDLVELHYSAT
jgi:hypothetical protein